MRLTRVLSVVMLSAVLAAPMASQIPSGSGRGGAVRAAPKIFVANPYVRAVADSAASVEVGEALRDRMDRVAGSNFQVIPREQMNDALEVWGYPQDAILTVPVSRRFAQEMAARALFITMMSRRQDGRYLAITRFAGLHDDAGYVIRKTQEPGESLGDFGKELANDFKDPIRAYQDAKQCTDFLMNPDKRRDAVRAAEKAISRVPNQGLAEMCLAQISKEDGEPSDSVIAHINRAIEGDPLSLPAFTMLAEEYESLGDTNKVIEAFQAMLLVAPTNQALRESAIKLFNQYGRPGAAVAIADEGLSRDPYNPDLYDLKANAHAVAGEFPEALAALAAIYDIDSTAVDSTYFLKVTVFADAAADSVALMHWAEVGVRKYPENITLLEQLAGAYVMAGELDSAIVATARLNELDPTSVTPALATAQALMEARRVPDAIPFIEFAVAQGTDTDRVNSAAILTTGALPLLQPPQDLEGAALATRTAIGLVQDDSPPITQTANYVLGLSSFLLAAALDEPTEEQKSCEMAGQMNELITESETALHLGKETNAEQVETFLGYVEQYKPRIASMLTAYCDGSSGGSGR